ncbi:Dabb family protein [Sulfurimonas sp. MAG313]|nr:Dabb family protein [Sulfurimonas sp. MAG313]MDF1880245.1 Dabb family protein [Sulfurimonas sp. MAG313]
MIVHIVMLSFKEKDKVKNLKKIKESLESLTQKIGTLKSMEVGLDFMQSERSFDLVLSSKFDDKEGLSNYASHPAHLEVVAIIKEVTDGVKVVDYEI